MRLHGRVRHQMDRIGVPSSKKIWATEINYGVTGGGLADGAATAAGLALRTAERWLSGRLVARQGQRPCARDRRGTYHCVVRSRGVVRSIYWNPHREVRVQVPRHSTTRVLGRAVARHPGRHTVRVGYEPMVVRTRR